MQLKCFNSKTFKYVQSRQNFWTNHFVLSANSEVKFIVVGLINPVCFNRSPILRCSCYILEKWTSPLWMCSFYNASRSATLCRLKILANWACLKLVSLAVCLRTGPFESLSFIHPWSDYIYITLYSFEEYNANFYYLNGKEPKTLGSSSGSSSWQGRFGFGSG